MFTHHRRVLKFVECFPHCHPERKRTIRRIVLCSRGTLCCGGVQMRDEYMYYIYMMQSVSRHALYIGMTSNLRKRVWQHKNHVRQGFTDDYNCTRLVYWESFDDVINAINREKQLKRWRREKKEWLIERKNPRWQDLAADWYPAETQGPSTAQDLSKQREILLRSG